MNNIIGAITFAVLGTIALIIHYRQSAANKEKGAFERPYLRNIGFFLIFFAIYNLIKYFRG